MSGPKSPRLKRIYLGVAIVMLVGFAFVAYAMFLGLRNEGRWWRYLPVLPLVALGTLQGIAMWRSYQTGEGDLRWMKRTRQVLMWSLVALGAMMIVETWR